MRLINTSTLQLEEFLGKNVPKYAILSHTWEDEEVSFAAFANPKCVDMKGYNKIKMTCRMTAEAGLSYVWIDTCCIDKSSSAELSEAINSMYRWYQRSVVCYTYLSDLSPSATLEGTLPRCRWFTRGWTLQELVASKRLYFFDQTWNYRGSKMELVEQLSTITGINADVLRHTCKLSSVAVAQKMSWVARRETTRIEDMAYCLLGIFDVNIPLLYGEEEKAFRRLQEEIIKTTSDLSIFAWESPCPSNSTEEPGHTVYSGVLAESPMDFAGCGTISKVPGGRREFSVSNVGVKLKMPIPFERVPDSRISGFVLPLDCSRGTLKLGIRLRLCGPSEFLREDPWQLVECRNKYILENPQERCLLSKLPDLGPREQFRGRDLIAELRSHALQVKVPYGIGIYDAWPWSRFDSIDMLFFVPGDLTRDCCGLRLYVDSNLPVGSRTVHVRFECMFYALGWSSLEPQCSLVNYESYRTGIAEIQTQFATHDINTPELLDALMYHGVPKLSWTSFPVEGTNKSALVTYALSRVEDLAKCRSRFWRVEFSFEIRPNKELPQSENIQWKYDHELYK